MKDWIKYRLGDISESCLGKMLDVEKNRGDYKPYLSNKKVQWGKFELNDLPQMRFEDHEAERYGLKKGDLVICEGGEPGRCAIWNDEIPEIKIQKALHRLRVKKGFDNYFIYYRFLLSNRLGHLDKHFIGSTIKHLTGINLKKVEFDYPDFEIQQQISSILKSLDSKISLNNRINQELEAMAKLIYDYWFVQFDFPDQNGKPYKSSGGKMVYNEQLKREIPEGWGVTALSDWIKNDKSGDWGKESEEGNYTEKVSCIRGADINGLNGKGEVKAPTRFILEKNSHKMLDPGDLIIEISGGSPSQSTGRMAFITDETLKRFSNPLICSNFCKALTLKDEDSLFNFAYEWNRLYDAGVFFGWEGKTSGIKNFLFESFVSKHQSPKPPTNLMKLFSDKVTPFHSMIQKNLQQTQKLSELRDWLLPMLMNGQVTVGKTKDYMQESELRMVAEKGGEYGE